MTLDTFTPLLKSYRYLLEAAAMTVTVSVASIVPATLFGMAVALGRLFGGGPVRAALQLYLYIVRGTPLLVLISFAYFSLPYTGFDIPPFPCVVLVLAIYFAAFMSEVFRAGMLALPAAQWDAARSLGMNRRRILTIVIFPQAFRVAAPAYVNVCVNLIQSTSLISVVGLWELTRAGREVVERTLAPFQIFSAVGLLYFVLCFGLARYGAYLERRSVAGA